MNGDRLVQMILVLLSGGVAGIFLFIRKTVQGLIEDMDDLTRQVDYIIEYLEKERADDGK